MYRTHRFNGYATAFLVTHSHCHGCARRASCTRILVPIVFLDKPDIVSAGGSGTGCG